MRTDKSRGLVLAASLLALAPAYGCGESPAQRRDAQAGSAQQESGAELGRGIGALELKDATGRSVTWASTNGRRRALFFGFTHCPVICPLTVWQLNDAMDRLGPLASAMEIQFVSLDPERDTPEALRDYFSGFKGRVRAFTGTPGNVDAAARAFGVTYRKTAGDNGAYSIDHSTLVYLLSADGKVINTVAYDAPPSVLEARLRELAAAN